MSQHHVFLLLSPQLVLKGSKIRRQQKSAVNPTQTCSHMSSWAILCHVHIQQWSNISINLELRLCRPDGLLCFGVHRLLGKYLAIHLLDALLYPPATRKPYLPAVWCWEGGVQYNLSFKTMLWGLSEWTNKFKCLPYKHMMQSKKEVKALRATGNCRFRTKLSVITNVLKCSKIRIFALSISSSTHWVAHMIPVPPAKSPGDETWHKAPGLSTVKERHKSHWRLGVAVDQQSAALPAWLTHRVRG